MKYVATIFVVLAAAVLSVSCSRHAAPSQQQQLVQDIAVQRHIENQLHEQQQIMGAREHTQAQMLGALSPAHRQLLARLVGELATSPKPNVMAAVNELDAALTPSEKKAVLDASASLRRQYQGWLAENVHAENVNIGQARNVTEDPGMTLLLSVVSVTSHRTSMAAHAQPSPRQ